MISGTYISSYHPQGCGLVEKNEKFMFSKRNVKKKSYRTKKLDNHARPLKEKSTTLPKILGNQNWPYSSIKKKVVPIFSIGLLNRI